MRVRGRSAANPARASAGLTKPRRSASAWVRTGAGRLVKSSSARGKNTAAATSSDQRMCTKNASAW